MRKLITIGAAVLLTTSLPAAPAMSDEEPPPPAPLPPNVILVVSDDQVKGTEDAMPVLSSEVIGKGLTFEHGVTPTALCCPSRTSLLTGNQSHTTGVYSIENANHGGWKAFHDLGAENDTLATRLDGLGYNTGLFGKYLNGFQAAAPADFVPPGWDMFRALRPDDGSDASYYNYGITGLPNHYGSTAADYSTDVLGQMAASFVASTPADQPFFVMYTPYGPHSPFNPAPRDKNLWPVETTASIPAFNEADMSDKPAWVAAKPLVDPATMASNLRRQHTAVMSVDDQLGNIMAAAGDRISNTVIIYMSDNGLMLGSHRIAVKDVPYRMATEVPMYVRWDGVVEPGTTTSRVTPQIDLTAMVRDGIGLTDWSMEGLNPLTTPRDGVATEQLKRNGHPAYCGWRTATTLYTKYSGTAGQEFYDYTVDPDELQNRVTDPAYAEQVAASKAESVAHCWPVPPGFKW